MTEFSICTYNIQAGIGAEALPDYVKRLHFQFFNSSSKRKTLKKIGTFIKDFDIVCLQEVDLGGRRSGFENQVEILQDISGHEFCAQQENRRVGKISRHGNAILSRFELSDIWDKRLPGRVNGRGALGAKVKVHGHPIDIVNAHFSLGANDQDAQLRFIEDKLATHPLSIFMGDLNLTRSHRYFKEFCENADVEGTQKTYLPTFPSWSPRKAIDHVLVSRDFHIHDLTVPDVRFSDHRPITARLSV